MSCLFLRGAIYLSIALLVGGASKPTTSGDPSARPAASARQTTWPDDVDVYFKQAENAVELPTASLRTIRARPEGIARAELYMRWLVQGVGFSKRSPIFVRDNGDGTYTVVDGNSTTAVSKKQGLTQVRAIVLGPGEEPPKKPTEEERLRLLRPRLEAEIAKGRLSGTVDEQIATVKRIRAAHKEQFVPTINELERIFPDAYVIGRVKTLESALGRLIRSKHMKTAEDLYDVTGTRIITRSIDEVMSAAQVLRSRYQIRSVRDHIKNPKGNYRAYHLRVRWPDGLTKEIQVTTLNQHHFAQLSHDVYKPKTQAQSAAIKTSGSRINEYFTKLANYFLALDTGGSGTPPDCPTIVREAFKCFVPAPAQ